MTWIIIIVVILIVISLFDGGDSSLENCDDQDLIDELNNRHSPH